MAGAGDRGLNHILTRILKNRREQIEKAKQVLPLAELKAKAAEVERPLGFAKRLMASTAKHKVIAEIKRISPGTGFIRQNFNPVEIALGYEAAGAGAISVLTEVEFFGGSLDYLKAVSDAVSIPTLRKDFILDEYQLYEALLYGADAVLLMAVNFDSSQQLAELAHLAAELHLDILLEVHRQEELALLPDVPLSIGINNRDFHSESLAISLDTTKKLAPKVPKAQMLVSESGIRSAKDMKMLEQFGVDSFLIGSAFMEADNPGKELANFLAGG